MEGRSFERGRSLKNVNQKGGSALSRGGLIRANTVRSFRLYSKGTNALGLFVDHDYDEPRPLPRISRRLRIKRFR